MANFFKEYQAEVKTRHEQEQREEQQRREEADKKKMSLEDAIYDILTDMTSVELIDFLETNGYTDICADIDNFAYDLNDELLSGYIIIDGEEE